VQASAPRLAKGVAPLRAGRGNSFFWRKLHSLTGIVPVGVFLLEHFVSNAEALNGPAAYAAQVKFLNSLPFRTALEWIGVFIPLAFHGLYGLYIWWRGESNVKDYPWAGNWGYAIQRYTGILAFVYIAWHVYSLRFHGVHLPVFTDASFYKVQNEMTSVLAIVAYIVGIGAASWHFGYGIFLFCAKWGIVSGDKGQKRMQAFGVVVSLLFMVIGYASLYAFIRPKPEWPKHNITEWQGDAASAPTLDHNEK
jgi:succinate dehydrogenase / fumarate reductase cytochrome b subunit